MSSLYTALIIGESKRSIEFNWLKFKSLMGERDEELKTLYLSINLEEAELNMTKKRIGHRIENHTCKC